MLLLLTVTGPAVLTRGIHRPGLDAELVALRILQQGVPAQGSDGQVPQPGNLLAI
jgi:hypothetical protein